MGDGYVRYLTASQRGQTFVVRLHQVVDEGSDDFRDISEFSPLDPEEYVGEGAEVASTETAESALDVARAHGGSADRWVNAGLAADEYWRAKSER
jgi:hypothetical protein